MAQIEGKGGALWGRAALVARQRPLWGVTAALIVGLVVSASMFGGVLASGFFSGDQAGVGGFESESGARRSDGADSPKRDGDSVSGDAPRGGDDALASDSGAAVVVDVAGAVANPGVYELEEGSRVDDALDMAGGLKEDADISGVNRATLLVDGQRVYIPRVGEQMSGDGGVAPASGQTGEAAGATSSPVAPQLVNINSAGVSELDALPGVGPATAQAIVDDRKENGPFTMVEDIMRVSGIGEKKFEKLKSLICI